MAFLDRYTNNGYSILLATSLYLKEDLEALQFCLFFILKKVVGGIVSYVICE